jgi:hypothetical protein
MLLALCVGAGIQSAQAAGLIAGDLSHDDDVDSQDVDFFLSCLSGAARSHNGSDMCDEADLDHDGDVDLTDFGMIQACLTGPNLPGDPACGGCVRPRSNRTVGPTTAQIYAGDYTFVTVGDTQEVVNYQLRNNANNSNVGSPVAGTGGAISLSSSPLTANTTFNVLAINAVWGCSVQLANTVSVTVIPYVAHNKIGVHSVIGRHDGWGDFVQYLADAGKPVNVVKCLDDFGVAYVAKQANPASITIGRINETSQYDLQGFDAQADPNRDYQAPADLAQDVFANIQPIWAQNPHIDIWEICNEWSAWWDYQADFYIAMMDIAEAHNPPYRIAMYACSYGNPPESVWPAIARACARAKAHGNHILTLHEYSPNGLMKDWYTKQIQDPAHYGYFILRYRQLYAYLKQHNADCPLAITEAGTPGGYRSIGDVVTDAAWYDSELRKDPYALGFAIWTLGSGANILEGGLNIYPALPALGNYIVSQP